MLKSFLPLLAATLPSLATVSPTWAAVADVAALPGTATAQPALQPCPIPDGARLDLAATAQTDCCKGHKGVCGCRAGKIICCDGTASENCTCHGDDGFLD